MARYRPIAPKPESSAATNNGADSNSSFPEGIRRSPYLMNVWAHLQARPTRTRKRGRTAFAPPFMKRTRTCLQVLSPSYQASPSPAKTLALQGFIRNPCGLPQLPLIPNLVPLKCGLDTPVTTPSNAVSLPLLPCTAPLSLPARVVGGDNQGVIDLNKAADSPEEVDFMPQLGASGASTTKFAVIAPQAIRPVASSISVGRISEDPLAPNAGKQIVKRAEEVEKEVESEVLPAIVSDSKNRVRLTNAAYNEMVGQPECPWLDFTPSGGGGGGACRRIGGEVVLDFVNSGLPKTLNGFTSWVRIEWGKDGKKKVANAFGEATRLACESKDYLFVWRFHLRVGI
ncbi:uncharacterized protein [Coffea arabica]|uniref:Uncharacterized protein n=1 Tax=Coffea arabica TaxID=13443 RepID=A0A6P6UNJ0_COFAR|nr:uncharacterized protein LOC113712614 [Coffea arabica]